jgi:hypothetical protein
MIDSEGGRRAGELSDEAFARSFSRGIVIGVPLILVLTTCVSLGAGWPDALGIAALPTVFGAGFFGGFFVLMKTMATLEAEERAETTAAETTTQPGTGNPLAA